MKLKALKDWKVKKRYIYGLTDIVTVVNGIEYGIYIDVNNSGQKKMGHTERTSADPKKTKYIVSAKIVFDYHEGAMFNLGRNLKTRTEAKLRLEAVAELLVGLNDVEKYEKLIYLSRKYAK
jgi:hypothetical protein